MSSSSARRPVSASRGAQLSRASSTSWRAEMMETVSPVWCLTSARKAAPLLARRQASVATARMARMGRRSSLSAQAVRAASARSMAAGQRAPVACRPSPRRTVRLKPSTTRKPVEAGVATSMRQLLVPRSRAAKAGGGRGQAATMG